MMDLELGETHRIQAIRPDGQPVTGLTWTSSDPNVVSLSSAAPPLLSALAAGHVTITAGAASADVTVSATALAPGTVLWSNPAGGANWIVPAVPSPSGVADIFAFQDDDSVQAITSDGVTAWTANLSGFESVRPDFQGGLVAWQSSAPDSADGFAIVKFDGITGQSYTLYTVAPSSEYFFSNSLGVHTDGTIFAVLRSQTSNSFSVIGVDSTTGGKKFSVALPSTVEGTILETDGFIMVAGDGYAYVPYTYRTFAPPCNLNQLMLLRVNSDGAYDHISVAGWAGRLNYDGGPVNSVHMIANGDKGILISWDDNELHPGSHMAITEGGSASLISSPAAGQLTFVAPALQAQDGSFVGTAMSSDWTTQYMIAFDRTGGLRWSVPGYWPEIATADGSVIAIPGTWYSAGDRSAVTFDQNGNATGQMASVPTQSWRGNLYQQGSVYRVLGLLYNLAATFWALAGGQYTRGTAAIPIDSIANNKVRDILSPAMWRKFANSHCAAVFKDPRGIPSMIAYYDPSLQRIQEKQHMTNFYDVGNPGVGDFSLRTVTGGELASNVTLINFLRTAVAANSPNMGYSKRTAVVLKEAFVSQSHPEFTLVHELLHAYT